MGIIVDISPRLILAKRLRGMLKDMQFNSLHIARKFVEGLEQEITRQEVIIWDPNASHVQVEEAIYALPLLNELLEKRRCQLNDLQDEFFGHSRTGAPPSE